MGNKSKQGNVPKNLQQTVAKLYKRVAEMELSLAQTGIRTETLIRLLMDKNIVNQDEFNTLIKEVIKEVYNLPKASDVNISHNDEDKPKEDELTKEDLEISPEDDSKEAVIS
jgi:hypothetical protein